MFAELGAHSTKAEIIELGFTVSNALGGGRLAHVLRAYPDDTQAPVLHYANEFAPGVAPVDRTAENNAQWREVRA